MKGHLIGRIRNTKDFAEERITLRLRLRFILSSAKIQKKVLFLQMKTKYTLLGILPDAKKNYEVSTGYLFTCNVVFGKRTKE